MKLKKLLPKLEQVLIWFSLSFIVMIVSILLHNLVSGLFGIEEAVFFTIAIIAIAVYGIISLYLVVMGIVFLVKKR